MIKKILDSSYFVFIYMILFAILTRLVPHPWNSTAVGALALFCGRELKNKYIAFILPIVVLFISDMALGFHATMPFVYGAVLLTVWMGQGLPTKWLAVAGASVASSAAFFMITNLGVWLVGDLYPRTSVGLVDCFIMAWPFFRAQWLGDLIYVGALFGGYALLKIIPVRKQVTL